MSTRKTRDMDADSVIQLDVIVDNHRSRIEVKLSSIKALMTAQSKRNASLDEVAAPAPEAPEEEA